MTRKELQPIARELVEAVRSARCGTFQQNGSKFLVDRLRIDDAEWDVMHVLEKHFGDLNGGNRG
jgi:hypothetical protein